MDGCCTPEHHGWQHGCQLHTVAVMDGWRAPDARHWTRLLVARSVIDSIMPTVSGENAHCAEKVPLFSHHPLPVAQASAYPLFVHPWPARRSGGTGPQAPSKPWKNGT